MTLMKCPDKIKYMLLLFAVAVTTASTGCYYDVAEELYPASAGDCDTTLVTFAGTINPMIQQKCLSCHSQAANQGSVNLEGYAQVKTYADNGKLLGTISYAGGFSQMPQNEGQLSACTINQVKAWITKGAMNN